MAAEAAIPVGVDDVRERRMSDERAAREMSTLTGTSRTLERAVHGLQMNVTKLSARVADAPPTPGLAALAAALAGLTPADRDVVNAALSGRDRAGS